MSKFTDHTTIIVRSGDGGAGSLSFRREKYVAKGGPDGGDGGRGGDLFIQADVKFYNLNHLYYERIYSAQRGEAGSSRNKHGADGESLTVMVPPGTQVYNDETGELLADLTDDQSRVLVATGGIGGRGNAFFKTSTHQTPRFSQPGMPGEERRIKLDLKLIADVGLVGLPNAGKSTLLSMLTNARPKIADYPFTTLIPNLGVIQAPSGKILKIADIPGIIEGAHMGHGLGLSFLQHIERVRVILYLIDSAESDPVYVLTLLKSELGTYNEKLLDKPSCVLLTKTDTVGGDEVKEKSSALKGIRCQPVSALSGDNLEAVIGIIDELME